MAHVHLEDGAVSIQWLVLWNLAALAIIVLALYALRRAKVPPRKLAIAAMCVSVGFAIIQIEIPVFGGLHLNLTPFIGILVGPALGTVCVLVINVFSAAVGHGGWGMIGANTIVNAVEVLIGYYLYKVMRTRLHASRFASGFTGTSVALTVSAFLAVAIIAVSGIQGSNVSRDQTVLNLLVLAIADVVTGIAEGIMTGYIVSFVGRVRPDLLGERMTDERAAVIIPKEAEAHV